MQAIPMTIQGQLQLKQELQHLKTVSRPAVIRAISEARAHGDLKENAEYHAAKEEQGFIEGRISELEAKLSRAQVIDIRELKNDSRIIFGATIKLINAGTEEMVQYQIVGEDESDIKKGKISVASPIARALIGKYEGDAVDVRTPSGIIAYEVDSVEYV